jgi:hypothetical protein
MMTSQEHHKNNERIRALLECLSNTASEEADCQEFDRQVDCLAELLAAGGPLDQISPEIQAHLKNSRDCREEFEALIFVLKAELEGKLSDD